MKSKFDFKFCGVAENQKFQNIKVLDLNKSAESYYTYIPFQHVLRTLKICHQIH